MLDVAGIVVCIAFFVGCELYVRYCDRLLNESQASQKEARS